MKDADRFPKGPAEGRIDALKRSVAELGRLVRRLRAVYTAALAVVLLLQLAILGLLIARTL